MLVDPTDEEETVSGTRVTWAVDETGMLCGNNKSGGHPLSFQQMDSILDTAKVRVKELRKILDGITG